MTEISLRTFEPDEFEVGDRVIVQFAGTVVYIDEDGYSDVAFDREIAGKVSVDELPVECIFPLRERAHSPEKDERSILLRLVDLAFNRRGA